MKTIIVPTDFSNVSLNAATYAADMAMAVNANLLLLHATGSSLVTSSNNEINTGEKLLSLQKILLQRTNNRIKIEAKQVVGTIENEVIKMSEYHPPFAIVMGTHGKNFIESFFIESTTVYLAKHFQYPVCVVPPDAVFKPVHKIVFASDMRDIYDLPVRQLKELVTVFKASLHVVHAYKKPEDVNRHSVEVTLLKGLLGELKPHFHFVKHETVEKGVSLFAKKIDADMILVQPKKHSLFHKSDSRQFIFHAPVPVVSVHLPD